MNSSSQTADSENLKALGLAVIKNEAAAVLNLSSRITEKDSTGDGVFLRSYVRWPACDMVNGIKAALMSGLAATRDRFCGGSVWL